GETWRTVTWSETRRLVYAIASFFLQQGVTADRPVTILSDNSIEHALISLAAMHIGVPIAPISPAYSLISRDFAKLKTIVSLIQPRVIFVQDALQYARALEAIPVHGAEIVAARNFNQGTIPFDQLTRTIDSAAVS